MLDSVSESDEYDDLAEAAATERADRLAAHRRLRAWVISVSASAGLILLAVTVVSMMGGPRQRPPDGADVLLGLPSLFTARPDAISALGLKDALVLATIPRPSGWSDRPWSSTNMGTATDPVRWTTVWTAPAGVTDGPRVAAAALTGHGWQRCTTGDPRAECWQRSPYQLTLIWGPGDGCPAQGPCSRADVILIDSGPPPNPIRPPPTGTAG